MSKLPMIKEQIVLSLSHIEAENGLYLNNLMAVHEDEERTVVEGSEIEILDALKDLISEGLVHMDDRGEQVVFYLSSSSHPTLSRKS
jgi:hypothetical protein